MIKAALGLAAMSGLAGCGRIDSLLTDPPVTSEQWCEGMPCVDLFSSGVILDQPSSTAMVYLLGAMWLWAGFQFWKNREGQASKFWWSMAMLFGGVGALLAGTSYQAFGFELKCVGHQICTWTSWWEIVYMSFQVACFNAMLAAVAFSSTMGILRRVLLVYAAANFLAHGVILMVGLVSLDRFFLSYEMVGLLAKPMFVIFFLVNGYRFFKYRDPLDLVLLGSWVMLRVTNAVYYAYMSGGYTQVLWERGIWFNENNVLHVLVMLWVLYMGLVVAPKVRDYSQ